MSAVAVLDIHMLISAVATMKPRTIRRLLDVPTA
jgi:hypothetical protein